MERFLIINKKIYLREYTVVTSVEKNVLTWWIFKKFLIYK